MIYPLPITSGGASNLKGGDKRVRGKITYRGGLTVKAGGKCRGIDMVTWPSTSKKERIVK